MFHFATIICSAAIIECYIQIVHCPNIFSSGKKFVLGWIGECEAHEKKDAEEMRALADSPVSVRYTTPPTRVLHAHSVNAV